MKLPKDFKMIIPFKEGGYQLETFIYGITHQNPALLLGLGLGKTMVSLQIARYRIQKSKVRKVLVVAPASLLYTWKKKGVDWCTEYGAMILHDKREERIDLIQEFEKNDCEFGIINYEALPKFGIYLSKCKIDMVIADESSRYIRNHTAARTDAITWFGDQSLHNIILSGTPIANKPLDLWSQYRFLDGGLTFGNNFYSWRYNYFNKLDYNKGKKNSYTKWVLKPGFEERLSDMMFLTSIAFKPEHVLEFRKAPIYHEIIIPRSEVEPDYSNIEEQVITEIETELGKARTTSINIFAKIIKLQQLTSGYIKDDNGTIQFLKHTPKLNALIDEIASIIEAGEAVVVWCRFLPSLDKISSMLKKKKIKHTVMSGRDSPSEKEKKWRGYQSSKTTLVFLGQIAAGGIGIELFKIDSTDRYQHTLYYEKTFIADDTTQSRGRTDRIGQNAICRYVDFIIEGTIDEKIEMAVKDNISISDAIMRKGLRGFLR